jgi:hypothetical protein
MKGLAAVGCLLALGACSTGAGDMATQPVARSIKALPFAPPPPPLSDEGGACSADVKQCADGSYVSRNPARDCAFNACPGETQ